MRTTVELPDDLRARLIALAARRGQKGFSGIVAEAVERYLDNESGRDNTLQRALSLRGSIDPEEAGRWRDSVAQIRSHWR